MSLKYIVRSASGQLGLRTPQAQGLYRLHWAVVVRVGWFAGIACDRLTPHMNHYSKKPNDPGTWVLHSSLEKHPAS